LCGDRTARSAKFPAIAERLTVDFVSSQTGKIFLVVDGHPAHKANAVKTF
jgi:hypothetical protein